MKCLPPQGLRRETASLGMNELYASVIRDRDMDPDNQVDLRTHGQRAIGRSSKLGATYVRAIDLACSTAHSRNAGHAEGPGGSRGG